MAESVVKRSPQIQNTNFRLLWGTRKSFLGALGLLLLGAILIFFFIWPQATQAWENYQTWQKAKNKQEQLKKKLDDLLEIEKAPAFKYESLVNAALPDRKPLLELIQSLSVVSRETGVIINRFELSPGLVASDSAGLAQTVNGAAALSVEYAISGTFDQVNDFLKRLEEVTPFSTIVDLNIGSEITAAEGSGDNFSASITSETYFFVGSVTTGQSTALPRLTDEAELVLQALDQYDPVVVNTGTEIMGGNEEPFGETLDLFNSTEDGGASTRDSGENSFPTATTSPSTPQPTLPPATE